VDHSKHLMGRQPILNGREEIVGYELLFRSPASLGAADFRCSTRATSQVMFDILSSFGVREVLGEHRGFINVDADMLMSDAIELLPTANIGLELLEDIVVTPQIVDRCRELKKPVVCWCLTITAITRAMSRFIRELWISSSWI